MVSFDPQELKPLLYVHRHRFKAMIRNSVGSQFVGPSLQTRSQNAVKLQDWPETSPSGRTLPVGSRPQRGHWQPHWEYPGLRSIRSLPTQSLRQEIPAFDAKEITEPEGIVIQARGLTLYPWNPRGWEVGAAPTQSSGATPKSRRQVGVI